MTHPEFITIGSAFTGWPTFTCDRCERAFTGTETDAHEHVAESHED